jgi:hypothetical protein
MRLLKKFIHSSDKARHYIGVVRGVLVLFRNLFIKIDLSIKAIILKTIILRLFIHKPTRYSGKLCKRSDIKILLLRFQYRNGCQNNGTSQGEDNLSDSIKKGLTADLFEYFYDLNDGYCFAKEKRLVSMVDKIQPDLILLSSYSTTRREFPHIEAIHFIRRKYGIPIVAIWWDSVGSKVSQQLIDLEPNINLNILIESSKLAEGKTNPSQFLRLWAPISHLTYSPTTQDRDIMVSFIGSTGSYRSIRNDYLQFLIQKGIRLYLAGYDSDRTLTESEYSNVLARSKISINFSHSVEGMHQMKGRVLEVLFSGALLFENRNSETPLFFKPGVHYVEFDSKEDLLEKINYYHNNPVELEKISHQGRNWALNNYTQQDFWRLTMERLYSLNTLSLNNSRKS